MIRKLITLAALVPFMASSGSYTANHSSVVTWVKIYNSNVIYFGVKPCLPTLLVAADILL